MEPPKKSRHCLDPHLSDVLCQELQWPGPNCKELVAKLPLTFFFLFVKILGIMFPLLLKTDQGRFKKKMKSLFNLYKVIKFTLISFTFYSFDKKKILLLFQITSFDLAFYALLKSSSVYCLVFLSLASNVKYTHCPGTNMTCLCLFPSKVDSLG